jgi:hypothetical protein
LPVSTRKINVPVTLASIALATLESFESVNAVEDRYDLRNPSIYRSVYLYPHLLMSTHAFL